MSREKKKGFILRKTDPGRNNQDLPSRKIYLATLPDEEVLMLLKSIPKLQLDCPGYVRRLRHDMEYAARFTEKIVQLLRGSDTERHDKALRGIDKSSSFYQKRQQIAEEYLNELDHKVAGGALRRVCGKNLIIVFDDSLTTGEGWTEAWREGDYDGRIQRIQMRKTEAVVMVGPTTSTEYFCIIQISGVMVQDSEQLKEVIAHEFCHGCEVILTNCGDDYAYERDANGGIDEKSRNHGKDFRKWTSLITSNRSLGIPAIYTYGWLPQGIDERYIWMCNADGCGVSHHSKERPASLEHRFCRRSGCTSRTLPIKNLQMHPVLSSYVDAVTRWQGYFRCKTEIPVEMIVGVALEVFYPQNIRFMNNEDEWEMILQTDFH